MAFFLNWEPTGVYAKFSGICAMDDMWQTYEEISGNSHPDGICYAIFDYLDVERHNISASEIVKVAAFDVGLAYFCPALKFASVATDGRALELWQRLVAVSNMPGRHGMFPTVSAARHWLGAGETR